jgi:hypothetical protein
LAVAQVALKKNVKSANKNLKKASKNVKGLQNTLQDKAQAGLSVAQDALQSGLSTTQDALGKGAKNAGKGLQKAQKNIQGMGDSLQSRMERAARRRKRRISVFRLGMLTGLVMALLYTPWPGKVIRGQMIALWQGISQKPTTDDV